MQPTFNTLPDAIGRVLCTLCANASQDSAAVPAPVSQSVSISNRLPPATAAAPSLYVVSVQSLPSPISPGSFSSSPHPDINRNLVPPKIPNGYFFPGHQGSFRVQMPPRKRPRITPDGRPIESPFRSFTPPHQMPAHAPSHPPQAVPSQVRFGLPRYALPPSITRAPHFNSKGEYIAPHLIVPMHVTLAKVRAVLSNETI